MSKLNITHLVLSGGGMKGISYVGAMRYIYINNLHKSIKNIAATSIGSFIGLFLAFQLSIKEMEELCYDASNIEEMCNMSYKKCINIISDFGLTDITLLTDNLRSYIKKKYSDIEDDVTFAYLAKRFGVNMYISTTCIYSCKNKIFSVDETPNVSVFDACAASMALPILFKPVAIDDSYYYDGGMTNNFISKIFDNVSKDNLINMIIYTNYHKRKEMVNSKPEKMSLMFIIKQLINIYEKMRTKYVLDDYIDVNNIDYYCIFDNLFDINMINFSVEKWGLKMVLPDDIIDKLIFAGYDTMSKYINNRIEKLENSTNKMIEKLNM
jgi:predicted acylesterase/phospholipase RssA